MKIQLVIQSRSLVKSPPAKAKGSLFAKNAREFAGGMRARRAPRRENEINVARHAQLPPPLLPSSNRGSISQ